MPRKKKKEENLSSLSVDELVEKRGQIKELLASLEDDYRKADISEESYNEAKEKNTAKFDQITKMLKDWGISEEEMNQDSAKPKEELSEPGAKDSGKEKSGKEQAPGGEPQPAVATAPSQPVVASPAAAGPSMEVIESKIDAKIEKVNANIDAMKEANTSLSERMQNINETIGELRSQGMRRESVLKDVQNKMDSVEEQIKEIRPEKYNKELEKRDNVASQQDMRVEKLEVKESQIAKTVGEIKKLLESIGGLENISAVSKDIGKKMNKVKESQDNIDKLSSRIERMYVDLNKRTEDFAVYKSKQENMEGLVKDIVKSVDALNVRMDDFVLVTSFDELKKNISDLDIKINNVQEMISKLIPIARLKIPQSITGLQEEREAVKSLIESIEEQYKEGDVDEKGYAVAKKKNLARLKGVEDMLKKEWTMFEQMVTRASKKEERGSPGPGADAGIPSEEPSGGPGPHPAEPEDVEKPAEDGPEEGERKGDKGPSKGAEESKETPKKAPQEEEKVHVMSDRMKSFAKTGKIPEGKETPGNESGKKRVKDSAKGATPGAKKKEGTPSVAEKAGDASEKKAKSTAPKKAPKRAKKVSIEGKETGSAKMESSTTDTGTEEQSKPDKPVDEKSSMLEALEDSFKKGLLSKEAYEKTKKML